MASKRNAWVSRIAIAVVVVAVAVVYFAVPSVNSFVNDLCRRFSTGDFAEMRDFMVSYGAWAAVVSFALMIFQSVAAPLPAFILTFANANLFGWWQGAILSWTSAMAGAGRRLGALGVGERHDRELRLREDHSQGDVNIDNIND